MTVRSLRWIALALIGVALAATYLAVQLDRSRSARVVVEVPLVLGQVADFDLINRDGSRAGREALAGSPWVADFVFTRCALSCPRLTSLMIRLGEDAPGLRRVSFTVDPEHDTREVLADYASAYGVRDDEWLFLTGAREEIESLVVDGFKLPIVRQPPPELVTPEEPILHSNRFVLVDGTGAIRGYYEVTIAAEYEKLLRDVEALRQETDSHRPQPVLPPISSEACRREIDELHRFFEDWFVGSLPATDEAFQRFEDVLASDFVIIGPGGLELERAAILDRVRGAHASRSGGEFSIWIENARVRECLVDRCLVTYEEWQRAGDEPRGRFSSVVFGVRADAPNGVEWRHVHETWLPADGAQE